MANFLVVWAVLLLITDVVLRIPAGIALHTALMHLVAIAILALVALKDCQGSNSLLQMCGYQQLRGRARRAGVRA